MVNNGQQNELLLGDGQGGFTSTLLERSDFSSGVGSADFNSDSLMDALVVNDGQPNELLLGDGHGTFTSSLMERSHQSLGVALADFNGDSLADALVVNFGHANELLLSGGDGTFASTLLAVTDVELLDGTDAEHFDALYSLSVLACESSPEFSWRNCKQMIALQTLLDRSSDSVTVTSGDFNGDSLMDALVVEPQRDKLLLGNAGLGALTSTLPDRADWMLAPLNLTEGPTGQADEFLQYESCPDGYARRVGSGFDFGCYQCPRHTTDTDSSAFACELCPAGRIGPAPGLGHSERIFCFPCEAGTARGLIESECSVCPVDKYAGASATACTSCSSGQVTNSEGVGSTGCVPCKAGEGPNDNQTRCDACTGTQYSTFGICQDCVEPNIVNFERTTCSACPAGKGPNANLSRCETCTGTQYSTFGVCQGCTKPHVVSDDRTSCLSCPFNQVASEDGNSCICKDEAYNTSQGRVLCYRSGENHNSQDSQGAVDSDNQCQSCLHELEDCISCAGGSVSVKPGFAYGPSAGLASPSGSALLRPVFTCAIDNQTQCLGGGQHSGCADAYAGPLCSNCAANYSRRGLSRRNACVICDEGSSTLQVLLFVTIFVSASGATFKLMEVRDDTVEEEEGTKRDDKDEVGEDGLSVAHDVFEETAGSRGGVRGAATSGALAKLFKAAPSVRSFIGMNQILSGIQFSFDITFPPLFADILEVLKLLSIDLFSAVRFGCMGSWSFYGKFATSTLGPAMIGGLLFVFYRKHASKLVAGTAIAHAQLDRALQIGFTFIFLVYPMVCQTVFQSFKCQALSDDHEFLTVDFQTDCTTGSYSILLVVAVPMVILYPLGIPSLLFAAMWVNRKELAKEGSAKREDLAPLVSDYKVHCWYWEALEMTRKVFLTGVMIFFRPGSVQQLLVGGTIASFYMAATATMRPFVSRFDNNFKVAVDAAIVVTFNIAVMLNDRVDLSKEFLSEGFLNFLLIFVNLVVPATVVVVQLSRNSKANDDSTLTSQTEGENKPLAEKGLGESDVTMEANPIADSETKTEEESNPVAKTDVE